MASLTNTYAVVEEKKMTSYFYNNRILVRQTVKSGWKCQLTNHYFESWIVFQHAIK